MALHDNSQEIQHCEYDLPLVGSNIIHLLSVQLWYTLVVYTSEGISISIAVTKKLCIHDVRLAPEVNSQLLSDVLSNSFSNIFTTIISLPCCTFLW